MSCQHGNWDGACDICEDLDRQYELGKASARKEIERLTAERDEQVELNKFLDAECIALQQRIKELEQQISNAATLVYEGSVAKNERDALKADADRYRWMTKNRLGWFSRMAPIPWNKQNQKDALDAAIDAAIAGEAK